MLHSPLDRTIGLLAMFVAMTIMPIVDATSKSLTMGYSAEQISWARNLVHAGFVFPILVYYHGLASLRQTFRFIQIARAFCFIGMTVSYVAGLRTMALVDGQAIVFLFPTLVVCLSALFLKEHVAYRRWIAVAIGFLGVFLVVRPGFGVLNAGAPLILLAALFTALYLILTRKCTGSAPSLVLLFLPAALGTAILTPVMPVVWVTPTIGDGLLMLVIGMLAALGHLFIIIAYTRVEASLAAPVG